MYRHVDRVFGGNSSAYWLCVAADISEAKSVRLFFCIWLPFQLLRIRWLLVELKSIVEHRSKIL